MNAAVDLAHEQAGVLEDAHVFRHGGERHVEGLGQLGDRAFGGGELRQDGAARRVGQSGEGGIERIVNQLVYYRPKRVCCQGVVCRLRMTEP